eukprot:Skav226939  [mRNA]  locus=scaffold965:299021:299722:- [translate_table: standard]
MGSNWSFGVENFNEKIVTLAFFVKLKARCVAKLHQETAAGNKTIVWVMVAVASSVVACCLAAVVYLKFFRRRQPLLSGRELSGRVFEYVDWATGTSRFHKAARDGHVEVVHDAIHRDPGVVQSWDRYGRSALHYAARGGHAEVCRLLLAAAAPLEKQDIFGRTALHLAAYDGQADVAQLLVNSRADVHVKGQNRKTPLDEARQQNHSQVVGILESASAASADEPMMTQLPEAS